MEVAQVRGDVLLIFRQFGVPLEGFREALRDSRGGSDVLRFGQQAGCPNTVSIFQLLVRKVVGSDIGSEVGLVLVGVFHKCWERTHAAGINPSDIVLLSTALFLDLRSTASAASG